MTDKGTTGPARQSKHKAPALAKGLEILELLCSQDDPLTLSGLSERLNRSRNEIFRMVQELQIQGYIERSDQDDGYQITNKLFLLGMERPQNRTLLEVAHPEMRAFSTQVEQSAHIAIPVGDMIVVIARMEALSPVVLSVRVGHRQSIASSTSGIVLFANQPAQIQSLWLDYMRKADPDFAEDSFIADTEKTASQGYFKQQSKFMRGVTDIAFPVFRGDRAVAALTAPCVTRIDLEEKKSLPVAALKRTAENITNGLLRDSV